MADSLAQVNITVDRQVTVMFMYTGSQVVDNSSGTGHLALPIPMVGEK